MARKMYNINMAAMRQTYFNLILKINGLLELSIYLCIYICVCLFYVSIFLPISLSVYVFACTTD